MLYLYPQPRAVSCSCLYRFHFNWVFVPDFTIIFSRLASSPFFSIESPATTTSISECLDYITDSSFLSASVAIKRNLPPRSIFKQCLQYQQRVMIKFLHMTQFGRQAIWCRNSTIRLKRKSRHLLVSVFGVHTES